MPASSTDPRVARSRAVITAAAAEHFLRVGYLAANVDEIAAEARVSKRTIYNVVGGKEQLFRDVVAEVLGTAAAFAGAATRELADTPETLLDLAERLAAVVHAPRVLRLRRLLIAEAGRFPDLAREYYERGPGRVMTTLSAAFRDYHGRGLLAAPDPDLAAEHFAFLVLGASLDRALFTDEPPQPGRARAGAEAFLRAYRP
ncbi:TetR/AcrR family transcriptional regulator [Actinokineospora bangkokensis]|uniref:TetR family transcriptional regulator n=1 Tax=Actinokineospora bangkokensis TaxID=1193682 RepID=A0A1Q9LNA6_9PSEU|nr:TetR/AcrR family transcriptional regulator [Actinokineospora bangkokensis]OLR93536.1 TetR family transcriptional regulator [Actinokineospora bangkokensis]